ncbi:hypothetical protein ES708_26867 [subsurface metagenome]
MDKEIKICSKCFKEKPIREYHLVNKRQNIYRNWCKECESKRIKIWREKNKNILSVKEKKYRQENKEKLKYAKKEWGKRNPDKVAESKKKYRKNNKEKCYLASRKWAQKYPEKFRDYSKKYRKNNPEKMKEWKENNLEKVQKCHRKAGMVYYYKNKENPIFRITHSISSAIGLALKCNKNGGHWEDLVGYTLKKLVKHIEKQFKFGMDWDNYGEWEIDHMKPISSFNFNDYNDLEFKKCWSLKNLQPLWISENRRKGNKILCKEMI